MINPNDIPVPCEGFAVRELGEEIIFITEDGNEMHTLDETGSFIWRNINGQRSFESLLDIICVEYAVERPKAEGELVRFIKELAAKKIVIIKT